MPEFDLMRVDQCAADEKLGDSRRPLEAPADGCPVDVEVKLAEPVCLRRSTGRPAPARRGRPPRTLAKAAVAQLRKRREEEDVCFVCFDGGSLVVCDRRGCPKAYHPACVKRTEAFFKSRAKWNCGWHICTTCQKDSFYMCYTCPYSICKRCVKSSEFVLVRGTKGFCSVCMKTISLIENAAEANKQKVDFDDQSSWEYLFKIYWVSLKEKLSLSLDELTRAKNPRKSASSKGRSKIRLYDQSCREKIPKTEAAPGVKLASLDPKTPFPDSGTTTTTAWATTEILEFVGYMKHGDTSVLSKTDVETLVLEHARCNNLEDPCLNSRIVCDSKLTRLFGKQRVDRLELLKLLDSHFLDREMSCQTGAGRSSCDWLNRSEWTHGRESLQNNQLSPTVRSETSVAVSEDSPSADAALSSSPSDALDENRVWLYRDPNGKIQGPFSLSNLRQWNTGGYFPPEMRIWRSSEKQNGSILLTDALNGEFGKGGADIARADSRAFDVSPNSVSTDQSVVSSSSSVVTRNSVASSSSFGFALSTERQGVGSVLTRDRPKEDDSPLLGQSQISTGSSLLHERWNTGQAERQVTATVGHTAQSCGQNWNAATPSSAPTVWDSNSCFLSFPDNQGIDFLDLFSPTFKSSLTPTSIGWQPILADPDECDESVSDLLAEVEAMESQKALPSPTSSFRGLGDSTRGSVNGCFSPGEGLSPALDASKGDAMSSTNDQRLPSRSNAVDFGWLETFGSRVGN